MKRLLLIAAALLLLGAAPADRKEAKAWKAVEVALDNGNDEALLTKASDFLADFPDSDLAGTARLHAAEAAMRLERWSAARRHFEQYLGGSDRAELDRAKHGLALALARQGKVEEAIPQLKNVARHDPDADRATGAARELVELRLFEGEWKEALEAQELLLERNLYRVPDDLDMSKRAAEFLSDETLATLEEASRGKPVGGILALLQLERAGSLVDTEETVEARRRFARLYADHPLLSEVPGAEQWATADDDSDPGKIGVLLPTSGRYAAPGKLALRGIELAAQTAAELGIESLELVVKDTAGDPEQAAEALRQLVEEEQVVAVIGPMVATEAEALVGQADELGVPLLMLTQRAGLAENRLGVFNAWPTAEEQAVALVEQAIGRFGATGFAVAYPAKETGARLAGRFCDKVEESGGRVAAIEAYEPAVTDFRETGRRLKGTWYKASPPGEADQTLPFLPGRAKPQLDAELTPGVDFQVVFVPDNYKRVSMLAPGFLYEEISLGGHLPEKDFAPVTLMGGSALNHPDLAARGGKYIEGAVLVDGFFLGSADESTAAFVAAYRTAHGGDPSILEATAYDATGFVLQLLADGASNRRELRDRLRVSTPARSVTGARGFRPDGEMSHAMRVLTVKKGTIVPMEPPPTEATGEPAPEAPAP